MNLAEKLKQQTSNTMPYTGPDFNSLLKQAQVQSTGRANQQTAKMGNIDQQIAQAETGAQLAQQNQQQQAAATQLMSQQQGMVEGLRLAEQEQNQKFNQQQQAMTVGNQLQSNERAFMQDEAMAKLDNFEKNKITEISNTYTNKIKQAEQQYNMSVDEIFTKASEQRGALDNAQFKAGLEQVAQDMRLSDAQYVDQITRVAKLQGLEDDMRNEAEMNKLILGNKMELINNSMEWQRAFNADERTFSEKMMTMDIDAALAIANSEARMQQNAAILSGVGTLATTAASKGDWSSKPDVSSAPQTNTQASNMQQGANPYTGTNVSNIA